MCAPAVPRAPRPQVYLHNLAETNPSVINDELVVTYKKLGHGDVITVGGRRFRVDYAGDGAAHDENAMVDEDVTVPMGTALKAFTAQVR